MRAITILFCGLAAALLFPAPAAAQIERVPRFNKPFVIESVAFTAANIADGIMTTRDSRMDIWEAPFPQGSSELLGRYPTAGRYALVMSAEQLTCEFTAWKLEHSKNRFVRRLGHGLMAEAIAAHTYGAIDDAVLQSKR